MKKKTATKYPPKGREEPEAPITSCTRSKSPTSVCELEEGLLPPTHTGELHVWDEPISKLYSDDCGRLPGCSQSGKQYIMIACH